MSAVADDPTDEALRALLIGARRIAVVGLSRRPDRPSNRVARFLAGRGVAVVGVNPAESGEPIDGMAVFATLRDAAASGDPIGIVDVFRRPVEVPPVVDEAIAVGAGAVWLQLGIRSPDAERKAREAGLAVVADRCTAVEWTRLVPPIRDRALA